MLEQIELGGEVLAEKASIDKGYIFPTCIITVFFSIFVGYLTMRNFTP